MACARRENTSVARAVGNARVAPPNALTVARLSATPPRSSSLCRASSTCLRRRRRWVDTTDDGVAGAAPGASRGVAGRVGAAVEGAGIHDPVVVGVVGHEEISTRVAGVLEPGAVEPPAVVLDGVCEEVGGGDDGGVVAEAGMRRRRRRRARRRRWRRRWRRWQRHVDAVGGHAALEAPRRVGDVLDALGEFDGVSGGDGVVDHAERVTPRALALEPGAVEPPAVERVRRVSRAEVARGDGGGVGAEGGWRRRRRRRRAGRRRARRGRRRRRAGRRRAGGGGGDGCGPTKHA